MQARHYVDCAVAALQQLRADVDALDKQSRARTDAACAAAAAASADVASDDVAAAAALFARAVASSTTINATPAATTPTPTPTPAATAMPKKRATDQDAGLPPKRQRETEERSAQLTAAAAAATSRVVEQQREQRQRAELLHQQRQRIEHARHEQAQRIEHARHEQAQRDEQATAHNWRLHNEGAAQRRGVVDSVESRVKQASAALASGDYVGAVKLARVACNNARRFAANVVGSLHLSFDFPRRALNLLQPTRRDGAAATEE